MSGSRQRRPRLKILRKGGWLDAILFGLLFTAGSIFVLSLLTSTFKNSLRETVWTELLTMSSTVTDGVRAAGFDRVPPTPEHLAGLRRYLQDVRSSDSDLVSVCLVVPDGNMLHVVAQAGLYEGTGLDKMDMRLVPLVRRAQNHGEAEFSGWEFIHSETIPIFTQWAEAPEFTAQAVRIRLSPEDNPPVVLLFYNAPLIQQKFIAIDDLRATVIAVAILLATILSFFIRYRSLQRQEAIEERLAAVNLLGRRDAILAAVAAAADDLMSPGDQTGALGQLVRRLRVATETEVAYLAMRSGFSRPGGTREPVVIGQVPAGGMAIGFDDLEGGACDHWNEELCQNRVVGLEKVRGGGVEELIRRKGHVRPVLLPLVFEGRLIGLLVFDLGEGEETWDPGLLDTLKLAADLAAAAWMRQEQELKILETSKMQAMGRVAGGVAHEFNNLLHIIAGNARRLIEDAGRGVASLQPSERILEASSRGRKIVEQLLGAARQTNPDLQPGDLNRVVLQTVDLIRPALHKGVEVVVRERPGLPATDMDVSQIQQVILNLLINANDAVADGGRIEVLLGTRKGGLDDPRGTVVYCEVRDNGPGIPDEVLVHIFDPFFTTKDPGQGTGLGLSTSRGIMEQHRGRLECRNQQDGGAAFTCLLPVSVGKIRPERAGSGRIPSKPAAKGLVLVADDEVIRREVLLDTLNEFGFECVAAADGTEAVKLAEENRGSIRWVITDWTMPGMHGSELATELRRILPNVPIIVTTGYALKSEDHPDIDDVVHKPFTGEEIFARMQAVRPGQP